MEVPSAKRGVPRGPSRISKDAFLIPEAAAKYWPARADIRKHMDQGSADAEELLKTPVTADSGEQHCAWDDVKHHDKFQKKRGHQAKEPSVHALDLLGSQSLVRGEDRFWHYGECLVPPVLLNDPGTY